MGSKELFFYELEGRGYILQNKKWDEAKHGFEDDMLNMAWEMWSSAKHSVKAQAVHEQVLDAPACVGAGTFQKGVKWSTVIAAAQRHFKYTQNAKKAPSLDIDQVKKLVSGDFVLVEKSKVRTWYQDDDEPENFCNSESNLDCLGDCLDHEDILLVNKIEDAIIQTTPMYGVWKFKIVGGQPERDCFVLCNTEEEAISIREEYRRMIDLEAQEPAND